MGKDRHEKQPDNKTQGAKYDAINEFLGWSWNEGDLTRLQAVDIDSPLQVPGPLDRAYRVVITTPFFADLGFFVFGLKDGLATG